MFDDVTVLPRTLRRVQLVLATTLSTAQHASTRAGLALKRLSFDGRLRVQARGDLPSAEVHAALRERWWSMCRRISENKESLDGLVWLRADVIVEDPHLIERLAEAWAIHDSVLLVDSAGAPVLWALSRGGVCKWMHAAAVPPGDLHGQAASDSPTRVEPAAQPVARTGVADATARMQGDFPQAELQDASRGGLKHAGWSLAVALGGADQDGGSLETFRGGATLARSHAPLGRLPSLLVVCATRETPARFITHTATGQSVARMKAAGVPIQVSLACQNKAGLPHVYNRVITSANADKIVLFVHDDVWIDDVWLIQRLHEGLLRYDVLGVAGNRRRDPNQPSWAFPGHVGQWDDKSNLMGCVAHEIKQAKTEKKTDKVSVYGVSRGPARLLDGVLLAARVRVLLQSGTRFDERFRFHFYDLDFCRTAEARGLRLGVWPMAISHLSAGNFKTPDWYAAYGSYVGKWQD